jgi:hypothetical protein
MRSETLVFWVIEVPCASFCVGIELKTACSEKFRNAALDAIVMGVEGEVNATMQAVDRMHRLL